MTRPDELIEDIITVICDDLGLDADWDGDQLFEGAINPADLAAAIAAKARARLT